MRCGWHGAASLVPARCSPDEDAGALREGVTSPKGVTAAALEVFMDDHKGFIQLATKAIAAAVARDQALARGED